jgi:hypothetical protein
MILNCSSFPVTGFKLCIGTCEVDIRSIDIQEVGVVCIGTCEVDIRSIDIQEVYVVCIGTLIRAV